MPPLHLPQAWAPFKAPAFRSFACHGCAQPRQTANIKELPCASARGTTACGSSLLSIGCLTALATFSRKRRGMVVAAAQREADAVIGQDGSREADKEDGGPVKALEAWLLQLELPQPLKPVLGTAA
eukprot:1192942-Amphidinium_carterae.2